MSQQTVEIVRRSFAAYDSGGLDALAECWHPGIDWRAVEGYLDDVGLIRGPDELRQYYRQWEETEALEGVAGIDGAVPRPGRGARVAR